MTTFINDVEIEEDISLNSGWSDSTDELVGKTIIEEEERLLIENENENDERKEKEEPFTILEEVKENIDSEDDLAERREAEIREKRYKRLTHLLKNSKMYALILKNKIQEGKLTERKKEASSSSAQSSKKLLKKQTSLTEYQVSEVLTEKNIEENMEIEDSSGVETSDTDFFEQTYVTKSGFTVSYKQPVLLEGGAMRDYQLKGLEWMINLFTNGVNGILGDEMGLGKTIQVISFICYLIEQDIKGPFLILAPLSTCGNWISEFKRFAPRVPTMLYHGTEAQRKALFPKILQTSKAGNKKALKVVITSYQVPMKDKAMLKKINWYYLIIDEGHRIKNHNSLLSRTLREFNTIGRLLLTGTPLQNDLSELWSLLNFLLPEVFSSLDVFESWFDIKELEKNGTGFMQKKFNLDVVNILQEILVPFLLRREKKDVNLKLPPKKEILIYCRMTQSQKKLYEATIDRSIELLLKPKNEWDFKEPLPKRRCFAYHPYGKQICERIEQESFRKDEEQFSTRIVLNNPQMQLRKIVNHPYLVQFPLKPGTEELRIDEDIVKESGKLLVLDALLGKLKARGHKVVIFSTFKIVLDILEDYLIMRNYLYCRLDGGLKINDRDEEISRFVTDPDVFIFLISVRSGGLGINLTAADTVIFFDSDWNPQVDLQAQDRCHRIGQTKPVVVYRLCAIGTIDERIIERGNAKRRLEKIILQNGKYTLDSNNPKNLNLMDLQELKKLLDSSDHVMSLNSNGFVLTDEELEALLDRSNITTDSKNNDNNVFKL